MRTIKVILPLLLLFTALLSCNKKLDVNASWKDITVVYGLLDQSADTTFIKITKAFLGPGDALTFAKVADSSTYPGKLEVRLDVFQGSSRIDSIFCDTVTIHNKKAGDSIFYYPDQLMYYTTRKLNENYTYKLVIKNKKTGAEITGQTGLVHDFEISMPQSQVTIGFTPGQTFEVKWSPAQYAKRYQLTIRFFYLEFLKTDPLNQQLKSVDWILSNKFLTLNPLSTQPFDEYIYGDGFYSAVGGALDTTSFLTRVPHHCAYIFSVVPEALNTYIEVSAPSMTIVQEKPTFSNITNGIGLFSARYTKKLDSLYISLPTQGLLRTNEHTRNRGF